MGQIAVNSPEVQLLHVCIKCGARNVQLFPHRHDNGEICGYVFICNRCAPIYAGGRITLEARQ